MTKQDIICNTADEILKMAEMGELNSEVLDLTLMTMALEIDNLAFLRHMGTLDKELKG